MQLSWLRYQIQFFSASLAFCAGIRRPPVNSPHKGQWRGALMFSLICAWINSSVNNRDGCRIKTGHSNLVSCFGPRMRALAKVFYRGESRGKIPCQRPNLRAKTWHKIWMTGRNPNYDTTPFLPFKTHKTSAKNPRLLTITGAIWFCRYRQCTPSQLWMHPPVAKECRLLTSRYPIFDRTDNLNP